MMQPGERFNPYKLFRGAFIPSAILEYPKLTASAKLAWARMTELAKGEDSVSATHKEIADGIGLSVRSIPKVIDSLVEAGFIEKEAPTGRDRLAHAPVTYWFTWHTIMQSAVRPNALPGVRPEAQSGIRSEAQSINKRNSTENSTENTPLPPTGERSGEASTGDISQVAQARKVHEHHCRVMSDNPDKPRGWKFEVYEAAYLRLLKTFTSDELMLASSNLAASRWHRGDNPGGKEYCDPFWLFGEQQARMKVAKWIQEAGGAAGGGIAPTSDEQYIHAHYAGLRDRYGDPNPQKELDYMRRQDEGRAAKVGKSLAEYLRDEEAKRERLKAMVG